MSDLEPTFEQRRRFFRCAETGALSCTHADGKTPEKFEEISQSEHDAIELEQHKRAAFVAPDQAATAEDLRNGLRGQIKPYAASLIEAVSPLWRQINDARDGDNNAARDRFRRIDEIREASDAIEEEIAGLDDDAVLAGFSVVDHKLWNGG